MQPPVLAATATCRMRLHCMHQSSCNFIKSFEPNHSAVIAFDSQTHHSISNMHFHFIHDKQQLKQTTALKEDLLSAFGASKCSNYRFPSYCCKQESELQCTRRSFELKVVLAHLTANDFLQSYAAAVDKDSNQSEEISNSASEAVVESKAAEISKAVRKNLDTREWFKFQGEGFSIRVPPGFEDISDPDESGGGFSLYGERAKAKTFAARFASPDGLEVLSVVIRPASQLKLSFFEVSDILELGSVREAAKIFVPAGARLASAQAIKPVESEPSRQKTYYMYEFLANDNCIIMSAAAANGKVYVVGATAPRSKWRRVGRTLRSATTSFALM